MPQRGASKVRTQVALDAIGPIVNGYHEDPAKILGRHTIEDNGRQALAVRAFVPDSQQVWLVDVPQGTSRPMRRIHPAGLYEAICDERWQMSNSGDTQDKKQNAKPTQPYLLRVTDNDGKTKTMHDPYAFEPVLTEYDLHLLHEGTHWRSYERMGAHLRTVDGVQGVNFAVWAPNAESVAIVGDFNNWDGRRHAMRKHVLHSERLVEAINQQVEAS